MDSNNRNNRNGGNKKNNKNLRSVISLIGWALVLTLVFNYILAATSGGRSFEVPYSEMMDLVEQDQIKEIQLIYLYRKDGQQVPGAQDLYPERKVQADPVYHLSDGHPAAAAAG